MFDFDERKLTTKEIIKIAVDDGVPVIRVAINANGYKHSQHLWGAVDVSKVYKGSALAVIIENLEIFIKRDIHMITERILYEAVRKVKPFFGREINLEQLIHDELIPELDRLNVTCLIGKKIYINPALAAWGWNPEFKVYEDKQPCILPYHLRYSEEEVEVAVDFYRKAKLLMNGK